MSKEKHPITVDIGLGDIKVASYQGYQQRVENVVYKFGKDFAPFAKVCLAALVAS